VLLFTLRRQNCWDIFLTVQLGSSGMGQSLAKPRPVRECGKMAKKSLKVDREKFEGIVKRLLDTPHTKREDVKTAKKKPEKLIPPQK
jgi:hypothetical protein